METVERRLPHPWSMRTITLRGTLRRTALCAGLWASAGPGGPAAAQESRPAAAGPNTHAPQATPSAEQWFRGGTWMIGVQAGGVAFTDFQHSFARPMEPALGGHRFRRRISAGTTGSAGVSAAYWVTNTIGVRASVAYAPSSFAVWTEQDGVVLPPAEVDGDPRYASLGVTLGDVGAVFRFPRVFGRVVPWGMVGAGVVRYSAGGGDLPPEARDVFSSGAQLVPAAVLGLGGAIPLQRRSLLLTFELTTHIAPTPLDDAGGATRFEVAGVPLRLEPPGDRGSTDGVGQASAFRLLVGLVLPIR